MSSSVRPHQEARGAVVTPLNGLQSGAVDQHAVRSVTLRGKKTSELDLKLAGGWNSWRTTVEEKIGRSSKARHELEEERRPPKLVRITDGLSKTAMVVEQSGKPTYYNAAYPQGASESPTVLAWPFSNGDHLTIFLFERPARQSINVQNFAGIFSFHPRGAVVSRFDGSVEFLDESAENEVIFRLLARSDAELLPIYPIGPIH